MPGLSQFFKYNPAEAKKLMSAAGYNGQEVDFYWMGTTEYGAQYTKNAELFVNMLNEGGLKGKSLPKSYQTEYLPNYYYAYSPTGRDKDHKGLVLGLERTYPTVVSQMFASWHPSGRASMASRPMAQPDPGRPRSPPWSRK
jgi:ABC-type transport system substrate-binding protein